MLVECRDFRRLWQGRIQIATPSVHDRERRTPCFDDARARLRVTGQIVDGRKTAACDPGFTEQGHRLLPVERADQAADNGVDLRAMGDAIDIRGKTGIVGQPRPLHGGVRLIRTSLR